jgi:hypothetical protein
MSKIKKRVASVIAAIAVASSMAVGAYAAEAMFCRDNFFTHRADKVEYGGCMLLFAATSTSNGKGSVKLFTGTREYVELMEENYGVTSDTDEISTFSTVSYRTTATCDDSIVYSNAGQSLSFRVTGDSAMYSSILGEHSVTVDNVASGTVTKW